MVHLSAHESVHIPSPNQWGSETQTGVSWRVCNTTPTAHLLPSAVTWALWLHVLCLFITQQLSLFSQNNTIYKAGHFSVSPHEKCVSSLSVGMAKYCDITQLTAEPDSCMFIWSTTKHYKCYVKADGFMYSDFCTSFNKNKEERACKKCQTVENTISGIHKLNITTQLNV
jgi:hypothetical protein